MSKPFFYFASIYVGLLNEISERIVCEYEMKINEAGIKRINLFDHIILISDTKQ